MAKRRESRRQSRQQRWGQEETGEGQRGQAQTCALGPGQELLAAPGRLSEAHPPRTLDNGLNMASSPWVGPNHKV